MSLGQAITTSVPGVQPANKSGYPFLRLLKGISTTFAIAIDRPDVNDPDRHELPDPFHRYFFSSKYLEQP